jgi:hypothetical protein
MWGIFWQVHVLSTGGDALELLQLCSKCDPAEIFLTSKFSYVLCSNLRCKTKTGTANRWEIIKSNPLGSTLMIGESGTRSNRQIIFITLFSSLAGARLCCASYHPGQPKLFCWVKGACMFELFFIQFLLFPESHTEEEHCWSIPSMLRLLWSPLFLLLWCTENQSPWWVYEHGYLIGCMTLMGWWHSTSITINQFEVWTRLDWEQLVYPHKQSL